MFDQKRRDATATRIVSILKAERLKQNLSMTAVAERAGISQQMVSYVEREMRSPTLDTLLRIVDALGVELSDVIERAERTASRRH